MRFPAPSRVQEKKGDDMAEVDYGDSLADALQRHEDAILSNLAYQRERVKRAQHELSMCIGMDDSKAWKAEHHDAWCCYLAVSAVARQAGLV